MQVKRDNREWLMRWPTSAAGVSGASASSAAGGLCARCDDAAAWIVVPDLRPMPQPMAVYRCRRCGTITAHAKLRAPRHSLGD